MHFAELLTASVLIWTSPTLGLPRPQPHPEINNGDLVKIGGVTFLAGGAGAAIANHFTKGQQTKEIHEVGEKLDDKIGSLFKSQRTSFDRQQAWTDDVMKTMEHRLKTTMKDMKMANTRELEALQAQLEQTRVGKNPFREWLDVKRDFDRLPVDRQHCVYQLFDWSDETNKYQVHRGAVWDVAVIQCGGPFPTDLLVDPRAIVMLAREDAQKVAQAVQAQSQKDGGDNSNQSKFNFAPVKGLPKDRFNSLAKTFGGALLKAQGSGMPAGMTAEMPSLGRVPVGVGAY
ncbi:MAG: hypothetical protein M1816_005818 [Peltula sp. TS41687]|nr:MAG: hypothetical protein M1816_005818 [Peltula sp. TS41687]